MLYRIKQLFYNFINITSINNDSSEEVKVIYAYRYLSWTLTSAVYLAGKPYSILLFKLGVVISLLICSKLLTDLYIKFMNNKGMLRTLVLIETMGTTLLLLPTGGLSSPFIWYALNPTLVAASYLAPWFCWVNLLFYIPTGTTMSYFLFNTSQSDILTIFTSNSNLILVFVLITLAVQLLANLAKRLHSQKNALQLSNKQKQESIEHIMSLYEIIEAFNSHSIKEKLFEELAKYTAKLTHSSLCFFWLPNMRNKNNDEGILKANVQWDAAQQQNMITELKELSMDIQHAKEIIEIQAADAYYEAVPILSPASYFGIIAISKHNSVRSDYREHKYQLLNFISKLSAVTLERFYLEDIGENLLLMEEQNRIANEIHDSVSQRLFSICYVIHGILGRWENMSKDQLKEYFTEMNHSANMAMQELRDSIYKLSSKKKGEKSLEVALKAFIDNISKLNNIIINFKLQGDEGLLPLALKKGITRIIREACGNSIRHGNCNNISVNLQINKDQINLNITDDGKGFLVKSESSEEQRGLGISNMKSLTSLFRGIMEIESKLGIGTSIQINIPLDKEYNTSLQGGLAI